jgi:hypothetical protein
LSCLRACCSLSSLPGAAQHLYETVYCERGQAENLIRLHKAQLASDRTSCHSPVANQVRLVLHTAAYWLMLTLRDAIPAASPLAKAEFVTIRSKLIKIAARANGSGSKVSPPAFTSATSQNAGVPSSLSMTLK